MSVNIDVRYIGERPGVWRFRNFCPKGETVSVKRRFGRDLGSDFELVTGEVEPEAAPVAEPVKPKKAKVKENGDTE